MARIEIRAADVELDEPTLVEGLPGIGLVGKIATDHVIDQFDMEYYAGVHCDALPSIAVYHPDDRLVRPPVRLYADEDRDLLALQSEVPVAASAVGEFAECITNWLAAKDVTPLYLSGYPSDEQDAPPELFGVATNRAGIERLAELGLDTPAENGAVAGPTGALLNRATEEEEDLDAIGLVVESDPQFPDPEAARVLIERGIEPLADVDVNVDGLVEQAEQIRDQKEELAKRMQEANAEESTQASPIRMFQ